MAGLDGECTEFLLSFKTNDLHKSCLLSTQW